MTDLLARADTQALLVACRDMISFSQVHTLT